MAMPRILFRLSLTPEEDEAYVRRATSGLTRVIGTQPTGWISPRATAGDDTFRRLVRHGYKWQGDALDDDLPYLQKFPEGDLVAVPLTIEINDLSHAMRWGRTPRQFVEMFDDALAISLRQPRTSSSSTCSATPIAMAAPPERGPTRKSRRNARIAAISG